MTTTHWSWASGSASSGNRGREVGKEGSSYVLAVVGERPCPVPTSLDGRLKGWVLPGHLAQVPAGKCPATTPKKARPITMHVSVIGRLVGTATRVGAHPATRGGGLLQHRRKARSPSLAACGGLVLIAMMTGGVGLLSGVGPAGGVTWASAQESCDSWVGPATGTVSGSIGSYWSMGVPAKGVPVCINKDGTYTVVMNNQPHAFVEVGELQIGAASGNPTLEVTGVNGNVALRLDAGATVGGNGTQRHPGPRRQRQGFTWPT